MAYWKHKLRVISPLYKFIYTFPISVSKTGLFSISRCCPEITQLSLFQKYFLTVFIFLNFTPSSIYHTFIITVSTVSLFTIFSCASLSFSVLLENDIVAMVTSSYLWIIWLQRGTDLCTFLIESYKLIKWSLSLSVFLFGLISFLIKYTRMNLEVTYFFSFSLVIQVPIFQLWFQIHVTNEPHLTDFESNLIVMCEEFYLAVLLDPQYVVKSSVMW